VRDYREKNLAQVDMKCVFPLWGRDSNKLAREFVATGFRSVVVSLDTRVIDPKFLGRIYDHQFLDDLPANVDPCAENGEFHTFAFAGPVFRQPIPFTPGEIVDKSPFRFIELLPGEVKS
jgi:diphthamide synthase (EF-2-diphthine--ammonia ligase)